MIPFILAFIGGIVVKLVDWIDDDLKSRTPLKYLLGALYGIILGYLIGTASFSMLFLGALIAQVFAKKVDTAAHMVGFAFAALSLLVFGVPALDAFPLFIFFIAAFIDELQFLGRINEFMRLRPVLEIAALSMVLVGRWDYFAAIIAFDIGYMALAQLASHFTPKTKG